MREQNVLHISDGAGQQSKIQGELLGKDRRLEVKVLKDVRDIQSIAAKCGTKDYARQAEQAATKSRKPWQLLVPTHGEPASMFEPLTLAMALPDLFVYGDLVPFLLRTT